MQKHHHLRHLGSDHRNRPFLRLARFVSSLMGRSSTFGLAVLLVIAWLVTGPMFEYSNTWQLFINTFTTIATFLMVFLIQNTQNRDAAAVQIKLDELIRSNPQAHTALLDLEELTEKELVAIKEKYEKLAERAREELRKGKKDTGVQEVF